MPFYVYILQSITDASYYKGFSTDPFKRLEQHNNLETTSTRARAPWKLIHIEQLDSKTEALKRERVLKKYSHAQIQQLAASSKNMLPLLNRKNNNE